MEQMNFHGLKRRASAMDVRASAVKVLLKYHDLYTALKRENPPAYSARWRQKVAASRCAFIAERLAASPHCGPRFTRKIIYRVSRRLIEPMADPLSDPRYTVYHAFILDLNYMLEAERKDRGRVASGGERIGWAPDWREVIEGVS